LASNKLNYISIDYGTKKSGIAYSREGFVFGYKTVPTKNLVETVQKLIKEKWVHAIILGMPYNIDGSISTHGKRVIEFQKKIEASLKISVILHDERLSSAEAEMSFDEFGIDGDIDTEAARIILIEYLKYLG
jgi:putative holliday junction resolvase